MDMIDETLRKHCQKCWLVCIGKSMTDRVIDDRVQSGFKGVSFVLKKDSLRNRTVVNVLDHWVKQSVEKNDQLIVMDEVAEGD